MSNYEVNADGLNHRYGVPRDTNALPAEKQTFGAERTLELDFSWDNYPTFASDLDGDGTADGWTGNDNYIPAGSYVTEAYLIVETAFAGGTSYNVGLAEVDGTVIDADGLVAAAATAELAANKVHVADGAFVGGTDTVGTANGYVYATPTGTFTAGKAKMVIKYITVGV